MKLRDFITAHGFKLEDYNTTVDELIEKGFPKGCFQDYELVSFVVRIMSDFDMEICDPKMGVLKPNNTIKPTPNVLYFNTCKRYELNGIEIHCGDVIDISIDGKNYIRTTIEYSDSRGYYATVNSNINLSGLYARFIFSK